MHNYIRVNAFWENYWYVAARYFTIDVGNFCYIHHCTKYPLEINEVKFIKRSIVKMKQLACIKMMVITNTSGYCQLYLL